MERTALDHASVGELVSRLAEQTSALVHDELRMAQLEMSRKGRYVGAGAGVAGGGALVAGLGVACLTAAAVLGLALVLPAWLAALVVGVALLLLGGLAALLGRQAIRAAMPVVPEDAIAGVRRDLEVLKR